MSAVDVPYIAATPRLWLVGKGGIIFFVCKDTEMCFSGWPRRSVNVQCNFVGSDLLLSLFQLNNVNLVFFLFFGSSDPFIVIVSVPHWRSRSISSKPSLRN